MAIPATPPAAVGCSPALIQALKCRLCIQSNPSRLQVNRGIRPTSLLLQLSASALPLLKLSDFSLSKDTLRHSEPRSQVCAGALGRGGGCRASAQQGLGGRPAGAYWGNRMAAALPLNLVLVTLALACC